MPFDVNRRITLETAMSMLPGPGGLRFAKVFEHGSLEVEIYAPKGTDPQSPHERDEVYVVAKGHGIYVNGEARTPCEAGDVLFAAAGEEHRFVEFSHDFATWVFFYGPQGGEHRSSPDP